MKYKADSCRKVQFILFGQLLKEMPRNLKEEDLAQDPHEEVYRNRPIENYGMSLLQGMGFSKEKGIGKNKNNALEQVLVLKPRPKGQGLGAEQENKQKKVQFTPGNYILITEGEHKDLTGIILEVRQSHLLLQLIKSHSQIQVQKKLAKVITKPQVNETNDKEEREAQNQKKKRLKWIVPGIRVKIVDKNSNLYLKKVVVTDLISDREFECLYQGESGNKMIRDLREKDVQTVVPKAGQVVLILRGPHQGEKARIFQRDKKSEKLVVQTISELELITLSQDDVAEFIQL